MPLALTGGQKLGIALVAAAFVAFALVSSFVLPRRDPNFPGPRLRLFVVVALAFFVAMMTAMVVLAREAEEEQPGAEHAAQGRGAETNREPTDTVHETRTETAGEGAVEGDAQAGKSVFADAGCGGCHALEEAGSTGASGPNLDEAKPGYEEALEQIRNGGGGMPAFKDQLSEDQIRNVTAFVVESSQGS